MDFGVAQILSDTGARLRERFWGLVGLWLTYFAIMMGLVLVFGIVVGGSAMALAGSLESGGDFGTMGGGFLAGAAVFYLAYILIAVAQYASLNAMASPLRQASFGEALSAGMRSAPTLLGVMILFLIVYFAIAMVFGAIMGAMGVASGDGAGALALVLTGVLVLVVLYLGCRLSIVFPIVPVDGVRNPLTAIGRSWSLTRGHALPIFLAMLILLVIGGALFAAVLIPTMGAMSAAAEGDAAPAIGSMLFLMLGVVVVSIVFVVAYSAMLSSIHARLAGESGVSATFE